MSPQAFVGCGHCRKRIGNLSQRLRPHPSTIFERRAGLGRFANSSRKLSIATRGTRGDCPSQKRKSEHKRIVRSSSCQSLTTRLSLDPVILPYYILAKI